MRRSDLILTCAFVACTASHSLLAQQPSAAPTRAVQEFYDWYAPVAQADHKGPAFGLALRQKGALFVPELTHALAADSEAQARNPGEIVGIDFDPFLNSQDPCRAYAVGLAAAVGETYKFPVVGSCDGKTETLPDVIAVMARLNGAWVFTNFEYPRIHSDLRAVLQRLAGERGE